MGLRRFVFRPDRRCIFRYCSSKDCRPHDVIHVSMVCSGHSVLYFLEEKKKSGYAGAEIDSYYIIILFRIFPKA